MGKVITQVLRQRAADPDGFVTNGTFSAGALTLNGALVTNNPYSGNAEVDFEGDGFLGVLVGFTLGLTGSTANATIVGRDIYGNAVTEVVTLPGASTTISSTIPLLYIESITLDAGATNLSIGILSADAQFGPWIAWDHYQNGSEISLDVRVGGTANYTLEHTLQNDLLRNGYDGSSKFDEGAPWAGATGDVQGLINGPYVASRVRLNSGTSAVLTVRALYSGGGDR